MKYHRAPFSGVSRSRQVGLIFYIQLLQPFRLICQAYFILLMETFQIVSFFEFSYSMYVFHVHIVCFDTGREQMKLSSCFVLQKRRLFHQSGSNSITETPLFEAMHTPMSFSKDARERRKSGMQHMPPWLVERCAWVIQSMGEKILKGVSSFWARGKKRTSSNN